MDLFFDQSHSLKEKRKHLQSIISRLRLRFKVCAAEVGHQELWQRTTIGIAFISNEKKHALKTLDAVSGFVAGQELVQVLSERLEFY